MALKFSETCQEAFKYGDSVLRNMLLESVNPLQQTMTIIDRGQNIGL